MRWESKGIETFWRGAHFARLSHVALFFSFLVIFRVEIEVKGRYWRVKW
ncbi:hypothetical protein PDIG_23170 [Penicillium digitatum PHI26]|uniref:Uncharacterized protein n=2 Tax=Penicillium digitatum TaxID=36651 RepID=K9G4X2_PEND2|nr:hypothetical protein PDIP_15570 [Penicillium digitatum Pd1]EKV15962.1 hypothetical protein PDIG_23170 [Penicillium digitatum PHI26]EKV20473.1 hypothetical protein PDIP_15570 [Penicillium digitatum Pd1]